MKLMNDLELSVIKIRYNSWLRKLDDLWRFCESPSISIESRQAKVQELEKIMEKCNELLIQIPQYTHEEAIRGFKV